MNIKTKRILGCLGVIACIFIMIYCLNSILRPASTNGAIYSINTFHSLPEDSVEVIAYGSSHTYCGFASMELYENYGICAYNYGTSWQKLNTTELFFYDSLRTQSPKVILIETYFIDNILQDTDMTSEIYFTTKLALSAEKITYLKQCFDDDIERYVSYFVPIVAFHENWVNIASFSFVPLEATSPFYGFSYLKTMGFSGSDNITPVTLGDYTTFTQNELPEASVAILDNIVETCAENNIEIVFYTVPYEGEYAYSDAMAQYAAAHDCVYFDFFQNFDETGLDVDLDFKDTNHLNTTGAEKVANYLGQYIADNYDVTDMRTVEDNLWVQYLVE